MPKGLEREKLDPLLPENTEYFNSAENTLRVMRQAPVVILVVNSLGMNLRQPLTAEERFMKFVMHDPSGRLWKI
mgnify:CR=1 FL=1